MFPPLALTEIFPVEFPLHNTSVILVEEILNALGSTIVTEPVFLQLFVSVIS